MDINRMTLEILVKGWVHDELVPHLVGDGLVDDLEFTSISLDEFLVDAESLLVNPRRFTYTPIIICRGIRPDAR